MSSVYHPTTSTGSTNLDVLRKDKDRQQKEIAILRKTVEEMDLRIDTQKQTLNARDESIKKLLEMLQSKGMLLVLMVLNKIMCSDVLGIIHSSLNVVYYVILMINYIFKW